MDFTILNILEISPPFYLIGAIIEIDTNVGDEHVLNSPVVRLTGTIITEDVRIVNYLQQQVDEGTTKVNSNNFINNDTFLKFINQAAVVFTSVYPLKTYPRISINSKTFIGDPEFGYQGDKAEVRYTVNGGVPKISSKLYKKEIIFKDNVSGTKDIFLKYKVFYKAKQSATSKVKFSIVKNNNNSFYNYEENRKSI